MTTARPAGTPAGRRAGSAPVGSGGASAGSAASAGTEPAEAVPPQRPADAPEEQAPEEQAPEEQAPEVARAPAARRRGPSWALFAAVCALAVVALAAAVLLWLSHPSDADLRKSALLAARSYTTSLTTFDARTLDQDVARVKKVSSPDFAKQYDATIAGVRAQITKSQTISAGTVVGAGIESTGKDTATVLVAVNQKIAVTGQAARTEANRVRMVLVRRSGNWYVQSVQRL